MEMFGEMERDYERALSYVKISTKKIGDEVIKDRKKLKEESHGSHETGSRSQWMKWHGLLT